MILNIPPHKRGDTWDGINSLVLQVSGVPLNLNGASISMELREYPEAPVALTFSTATSTIEITNANAGIIRIPKRIINTRPTEYCFDIQATLSGGDIKTTVEGKWKITADITI